MIGKKCWVTTLATDQREGVPAWQEAILLLMRWTKEDLVFFDFFGANVVRVDERRS